jgi:hypothetical protein
MRRKTAATGANVQQHAQELHRTLQTLLPEESSDPTYLPPKQRRMVYIDKPQAARTLTPHCIRYIQATAAEAVDAVCTGPNCSSCQRRSKCLKIKHVSPSTTNQPQHKHKAHHHRSSTAQLVHNQLYNCTCRPECSITGRHQIAICSGRGSLQCQTVCAGLGHCSAPTTSAHTHNSHTLCQ